MNPSMEDGMKERYNGLLVVAVFAAMFMVACGDD